MNKRFLAILLCVAGAAHAADRLVGGPYVVNPTARAATIGWVVETDGVTLQPGAGAARRVPVLRSQKVTLTGLKAGETVTYEIPGVGGASAEERKGSFKVPAAGQGPFRFVVFGDTRTRHDLHRKVVEAIAKTSPEFVLHTGDLVTDGYDTEQWPVFFNIEREMLRHTVFYPVLGNHERDNARFYEFFDVKTPYYSFDWGGAHFAILHSDVPNAASGKSAGERFWTEQTRWLEDDLARNQKADFRFIVMHHPPFTVNQKASHMSKEALALVPTLEKYNVQGVFAGHDHNYQHHVKSGIHYIVTGGGGAPLAPADPGLPGLTQKVESVEHYVGVRVEGKTAHIEAIALDGHVIENIELQR